MEKEHEIKTVVPALRFPEFREMGGWRKSYIYEECPNSYSGGTPKTTEKIFYGGNIPFIRSAEIGKNKTELYITQEGLNNSSAKMIQKGDLLIALYGANSGDIAIAKIDGAINQAILCLRAKENNLFIYYTLQKNKKNIVSKYLQGGQGNLSAEIIKSIVFYIPQKNEQQKITDCLSSLDDLIETTNRKIEALKEHKKGLMQRLFPKEGKNVPELRFPEFQGTKEWEETKLKNLCSIGNGKDYKHLSKGDIPVYGSGGYMTSVNDFLYDGESVCIGRKGTIDRPIFIIGKFWTVDTLFYTHSFSNCLPKFLYLIFQKIDWHKYNEAGGVPSLSKTTIGEINVLIPIKEDIGLKEQLKIVDCLFSLDELIEATSQKVEILKEHKKGLMQQLFPKI